MTKISQPEKVNLNENSRLVHACAIWVKASPLWFGEVDTEKTISAYSL